MTRSPTMPSRHPVRGAVWAGAATTFVLAIVLVGAGLWGTEPILYRDFIAVTSPVNTAATWGWSDAAPRAVPYDGITALVSTVVPTGVQQRILLLLAVFGAGSGAAMLLRRHGMAAAVTAAAVATWNPFVVERLLLGQAPTLLGYAMLPWIAVAAAIPPAQRHTRRWLLWVVLAALPAALTPFGGLSAVVAAVVVAVGVRRRSTREVLLLVAVGIGWCLPWLLPALAGNAEAGQTAGAPAFAIRADGPLGVFDVFGGGGVWAQGATPETRIGWFPALASFVLVIVSVAGWIAHRGAVVDETRPLDTLATRLIVVMPVLVVFLSTGPGLALWGFLQRVPGLGLLRDTHRLLGPSMLAIALGVGLAIGHLGRTGAWSSVHRRVVDTAAPVLVLLVAWLTVPAAPRDLWAAYGPRPVSTTTDIDAVAQAIGADPSARVLSLPWQSFRRSPDDPRPFLDPLPLAIAADVQVSRALVVEREGRDLTVNPDPRRDALWAGTDGPITLDRLRAEGIGWVVVWGTPDPALLPASGLVRVHAGPTLSLWRLN